MRNWLKKLGSFNADGRPLGLGLAVAMAKQRELNTRQVEEYLRHDAEQRPAVTTSA
ncbi:hypothetical protein [Actinophytocola sediminis]